LEPASVFGLNDSPISIYSSKEFWLQIHVIEAMMKHSISAESMRLDASWDSLVDDLVPVGLNLILGYILKFFSAAKENICSL
jgi:hypothetical protein